MANITVVSTTNSVKVDFGTYSTSIERFKGVWRKNNIHFMLGSTFVEASIEGEKTWCLSHDGNNTNGATFQVDEIDTAAPTDLLDLYTKLENLLT